MQFLQQIEFFLLFATEICFIFQKKLFKVSKKVRTIGL